MRFGISLPVRELGDDIAAIKEFAQAAEELGFTHLRVPDQVIRADSGALHEPHTVMTFVAAVTSTIELVPSVIILPARPTVLVAKQAATLDSLSGGRLRLGIGVGRYPEEYEALGADFHNRGARCEEQMELLRLLWTQETVEFDGKWEKVSGAGLNPLPVQRPIPMWIGAAGVPVQRIRRRIGRQADGWFNLASPEEFGEVRDDIFREAEAAERDPKSIGIEAGVAVVGPREPEWKSRVAGWRDMGLTHICLRTLGGGLEAHEHIPRMQQAAAEMTSI
ncbi:MAG: TIGR03619 family F420-dependent LLM class oxidoreductase [Rhodospirillaceae bacterium]|nr:TIGR03619 family F420-dependent LLM class oxidoreductase [Rhodospirillaceae bacterium]